MSGVFRTIDPHPSYSIIPLALNNVFLYLQSRNCLPVSWSASRNRLPVSWFAPRMVCLYHGLPCLTVSMPLIPPISGSARLAVYLSHGLHVSRSLSYGLPVSSDDASCSACLKVGLFHGVSVSRFPCRIVFHSHGLPVSWSACLIFCLSHGLTVSWSASIITCLSQGLCLSWSACRSSTCLGVCLSHGLFVSGS